MSTLEELAFYCRKKEPRGALAFLGESGCGKTFLIKNELKELLKDTHVIVHVSLFGIGSLDELHSAVKKNWVHALMPVLTKKKSETKGQDFRDRVFLRLLHPYCRSLIPGWAIWRTQHQIR